MGKIIRNGITYGSSLNTSSANSVGYDNSLSGLTSTTIQGAIDELSANSGSTSSVDLTEIKNDIDEINTTLESKADSSDIPTTTSALTNDSGFITETEANNYTDTKIAELVDSAPDTMNTLNELATAISDNDSVIETLDSAITNKADKEHTHDIADVDGLQDELDELNSNLVESFKFKNTDDDVLLLPSGRYVLTVDVVDWKGMAFVEVLEWSQGASYKVVNVYPMDGTTDYTYRARCVDGNYPYGWETIPRNSDLAGYLKLGNSYVGDTPPSFVSSIDASGNAMLLYRPDASNTTGEATLLKFYTNGNVNIDKRNADGVWTGSEIALKSDLGIRTDITGQTLDLDTLTLSSGSPHIIRYINKTNGGAANITNIPITNLPFILDVELIRYNTTTDYITRQTFRNATNCNEYVRTCVSGTWTSWVQKSCPLVYSTTEPTSHLVSNMVWIG